MLYQARGFVERNAAIIAERQRAELNNINSTPLPTPTAPSSSTNSNSNSSSLH